MKYITRKELEGYVERLKRGMIAKILDDDLEHSVERFAVDDDGEITEYRLIAYCVECTGYDEERGEMVDYFEIDFDLECNLDYGFNEAAHIL